MKKSEARAIALRRAAALIRVQLDAGPEGDLLDGIPERDYPKLLPEFERIATALGDEADKVEATGGEPPSNRAKRKTRPF